MVKEWLTCIRLTWLTFVSKRGIGLIRSLTFQKGTHCRFSPDRRRGVLRASGRNITYRTRNAGGWAPQAPLEKANRMAKACSGTIERAAARPT